jgi:hypothetical protein
MRIACVAGFFNPVKTSIDKQCAKEVADHSVVWVPQIPSGAFDLNILKQALFDAVGKGATDILIIAFIMRGREYQRGIVDSFTAEARRRSPGIRIEVNYAFKNAQDGAGVVKLLKEFGPKIEKQYPGDLSKLSGWITKNHRQTIILHPRAERGASKSQFEDVTLIYRAIDLLGAEYHAMRTTSVGEAEQRRIACTHRIQELGLELTPSISATRAGEEGADYEIYYPPGQLEKKRALDLHLKKGSDRDERHCLRIYFFWDDDAKKVVIGWLPSHLDTRAS